MASEVVKRIERQGLHQLRPSLCRTIETLENDGSQTLYVQIVGVGAERTLDMVECGWPVLFARIQLREGAMGGPAPCSIPSRFVEGSVRIFIAPLVSESESELIVGLAVIRVWIAAGEPGDRATQVLFGLPELAALQAPHSQGSVAARIAGIASHGFAPIQFRTTSGMAILREMQPCDVEFVGGRDLLRRRRLRRGFGRGGWGDFAGCIAENRRLAVPQGYGEHLIGGF